MDLDDAVMIDPASTESQFQLDGHPQVVDVITLTEQYASLSLASNPIGPAGSISEPFTTIESDPSERSPRVTRDYAHLYTLVVDNLLSSLKDAHDQVRSSQAEAASASAAFEKYINSPESGDHLLHKVYLETTLLAVKSARENLEEVQRILDLAGMRNLESMIDHHEPLPEIHTLPMLDLLSFQNVLDLFVQLSL